MLSDIRLIVLKEYREVLLRMGSIKGNLFNFIFILGVFGVFMPLQAGTLWLTAPWMPLAFGWLPFLLVSALVADSFAGERERHTLETLLTTALSDQAILLGKLAAAVLYGYGMLLVVMVVSWATVNVRYASGGQLLWYKPALGVSIVVFGFLGTVLIAAVGVLVSLKAKTVRQAGQTLSLWILGVLTLPALFVRYVLVSIYNALPGDTQLAVLTWVEALDPATVTVIVALVLLVFDLAVLGMAMRRFKRARLVFD
jgi:ABC-2 type transport system permease protein